MCIACVISYVDAVTGQRIIIVLDNRDGIIISKFLGARKLKDVVTQTAFDQIHNVGDIIGLFNDDKYANGQLAADNTRGALIVDERLHEQDIRRAIKTWGKERGGFCTTFLKSNLGAFDYACNCAKIENQHPHLFACWDIESGFATYRTDDDTLQYTPWTSKQTIDSPFVFIAQTQGQTPNIRKTTLESAARALLCTKPADDSVWFNKGLNLLQNSDLAPVGVTTLELGKDSAYERLVESVRIPYSESAIKPGSLMGWATRTSAVLVMHQGGLSHMTSRHYAVPTDVAHLDLVYKDEYVKTN